MEPPTIRHSSTATRTLVAGIGNIFLGDDGFGIEVVRRLGAMPLPAGVVVADFGIRGVHLAYELLDGRYDMAILVDATPRGGEPGTLYVIDPGLDDGSAAGSPIQDAHAMTPDAVLHLADALGGTRTKILIVGCEPGRTDEEIGLSAPVAGALDAAVGMVLDLARQPGHEHPR